MIVAGGSGKRMKSEVPKQFLDLKGRPVIIRTIQQFMAADESTELVVVLSEQHLSYWNRLKSDYPFIDSIKIATGGASRTESVRAGLEAIPNEGLVAIHDAVRPFVTAKIINTSYQSAAEKGSGVAVVALKDSIREIADQNRSFARNRSDFVLVQTPQTFKVKLIKKSYAQSDGDYSDDAAVFEKTNEHVFLVEGSYANIKITTLEDLEWQ